MNPETRTREYREGKISRRRIYKCLICGEKFQVDTLNPLPDIEKYCHDCKLSTTLYTFICKNTGEIFQTRCRDMELATLLAWKVDRGMERITKKPQLIDAALGQYAGYGFRIVEPNDRLLELYFKEKLIATYNQTTEKIIQKIHEDCSEFLRSLHTNGERG